VRSERRGERGARVDHLAQLAQPVQRRRAHRGVVVPEGGSKRELGARRGGLGEHRQRRPPHGGVVVGQERVELGDLGLLVGEREQGHDAAPTGAGARRRPVGGR
jgi:hypothetical protein